MSSVRVMPRKPTSYPPLRIFRRVPKTQSLHKWETFITRGKMTRAWWRRAGGRAAGDTWQMTQMASLDDGALRTQLESPLR